MQICSNCSTENHDDAKFCQNCGQQLLVTCSNCGENNDPGSKFCRHCGANLETPSAQTREPRLQVLLQAAPQELQEKMRASSSTIEGERKPVTILFADIVGSTSMAEKLDPELWKEVVSGAHRRIGGAIYRYEGTVAQLLGDGVLAFFGAPVTHEDDPIRAVHAALDIQDSIRDYESEVQGLVERFQMRIGLNTGTVVIGNIGSDMHMEYLAIGDAVNLAARLQSAAEPGKILLSETTARLVKSAFDLEELGEIEVKGKSDPIVVAQVLDAKTAPRSGRGLEGLRAPLIGREAELQNLNAALDALQKGHGQIVALLGEAGIGKSRLLEEVHGGTDSNSSNGSTPAIHWLEGRALSYGSSLSFWTINQLLLDDLGLSEGDPEPKIKVALQQKLQKLFSEKAPDLLPFLLHLLGIQLEPAQREKIDRYDGETLKRQTILSLGSYFERIAQDQPMVLVFEDLHWADPSTLKALDHLLTLTERAPLMVLLVMRVEREHPSWKIKIAAETNYAHRFTEIELHRLSSAQSDELVNHLLEIAELPTRIRGLIMARSDGNPFYLEEIIRNFIDQGVIVRENHHWRATDQIKDVAIPETLQGVLLARIDRLEEDVRSTLQLAAVIGRSFMYRLLEAIAVAEKHLNEHLTQLQRADLVREKARWPELEYIFKHSLTQEAAYESLLIERRKAFHLRVGEAIEALFADRHEEFYGLLAHHFEAAGEDEKAIEYLITAGDKSRIEDSQEEAIAYYERVIHLLADSADDPRLANTWLKLGLIYQTNFDYEQAYIAYDQAFTLNQTKGASRAGPPLTGESTKDFRLVLQTRIKDILPATSYWGDEEFITHQLFAGLAELDSEINVLPLVARSWEVLEGGTRYLFHLRDDVTWTDGAQVTASDFEWAWKHNLHPDIKSPNAHLLDDVIGARDYRLGHSSDPDSIGVRALDPMTLEVRLNAPVAYFIYIITMSITFPLPRHLIEQYGNAWGQLEHIQCNGPFMLAEISESGGKMIRNPQYFGEFSGNLSSMAWDFELSEPRRIEVYRRGEVECAVDVLPSGRTKGIAEDEFHEDAAGFSVYFFILNPCLPPFDDPRVRKAIIHAIDLQGVMDLLFPPGTTYAKGGWIPSAIAGHSPDLGIRYDPETAHRYLKEAGYGTPGDFPLIRYVMNSDSEKSTLGAEELARQLDQNLGIKIEIQNPREPGYVEKYNRHLYNSGWILDFPDPSNLLHQSVAYHSLKEMGWDHPRYDELVEEATITIDRSKRLSMYREADRILIRDEAVILPLHYAEGSDMDLIKPYVKNLSVATIGYPRMKHVRIENLE